jgi:hypothetical protein
VDGASMTRGDKLLFLANYIHAPPRRSLMKGTIVEYLHNDIEFNPSTGQIRVREYDNETWWLREGDYIECKYLTRFDKLIYGIQI